MTEWGVDNLNNVICYIILYTIGNHEAINCFVKNLSHLNSDKTFQHKKSTLMMNLVSEKYTFHLSVETNKYF